MVSYIPKKNRNVIVLSSQHQGAAVEGEEHDFKPEIILDYNKTKTAVDTFVHEYRCLRTSRPLALFFDFIDMAGHNAFLVLGQIMIQITTWENLIDADSFSCRWLKTL